MHQLEYADPQAWSAFMRVERLILCAKVPDPTEAPLCLSRKFIVAHLFILFSCYPGTEILKSWPDLKCTNNLSWTITNLDAEVQRDDFVLLIEGNQYLSFLFV